MKILLLTFIVFICESVFEWYSVCENKRVIYTTDIFKRVKQLYFSIEVSLQGKIQASNKLLLPFHV